MERDRQYPLYDSAQQWAALFPEGGGIIHLCTKHTPHTVSMQGIRISTLTDQYVDYTLYDGDLTDLAQLGLLTDMMVFAMKLAFHRENISVRQRSCGRSFHHLLTQRQSDRPMIMGCVRKQDSGEVHL